MHVSAGSRGWAGLPVEQVPVHKSIGCPEGEVIPSGTLFSAWLLPKKGDADVVYQQTSCLSNQIQTC